MGAHAAVIKHKTKTKYKQQKENKVLELERANGRVTRLENDLYSAKTSQLSLLEKLKEAQDKYNDMTVQYEQKLKDLDAHYTEKFDKLNRNLESQIVSELNKRVKITQNYGFDKWTRMKKR